MSYETYTRRTEVRSRLGKVQKQRRQPDHHRRGERPKSKLFKSFDDRINDERKRDKTRDRLKSLKREKRFERAESKEKVRKTEKSERKLKRKLEKDIKR